MKYFLLLVVLFVLFASISHGQTIYKPKGCSASTGPNVSAIVLQHPHNRYHLISANWSDIEASPGVFSFTALQNQVNTVKSYNKKYALAIVCGGPGSPDWLFTSLHAPYLDYMFRGTTAYKLPLWWDTVVQQRISSMVSALGNQFAADTSLALVYVSQMTANGIEGHLNGIDMNEMYSKGFTATNWINAAKQTASGFALSFPDKAIAFEVHDIDNTASIPSAIINDLYEDETLCQRVGAAIWWLSGKTDYQSDLLSALQNFKGDKYAQLIANSSQPERFENGLISTAFTQAKQLGVRSIEPWYYEYQNSTIDNLLADFNTWADAQFSSYYSCPSQATAIIDQSAKKGILIYPNPATKTLTIQVPDHSIYAIQLQIVDCTGNLVSEQELSQTRQIDVSNLPAGIYLVRLKNYPQQVLKFVKF